MLINFMEYSEKLFLSKQATNPLILNDLLKEDHIWIVHNLSKNCFSTKFILKRLSKHENFLIRSNVAENSSTTKSILLEMLENETHEYVLEALLLNRKLRKEKELILNKIRKIS